MKTDNILYINTFAVKTITFSKEEGKFILKEEFLITKNQLAPTMEKNLKEIKDFIEKNNKKSIKNFYELKNIEIY